jgi:UDP-2,4-diacetamido-2,4,6-trideoxy-beta-L-altropyranose hydrolase
MSGAPSVLFLTVAGAGAGLGHVKRCAALGSALAGLGASVRFAVAGDAERLGPLGTTLPGFEALQWLGSPRLALDIAERSGADLVVVDAYRATDELLRALRIRGAVVAAIEDRPDREPPVDLVIDRAYKAERRSYADVPGRRLLLGPRYALLEERFADIPDRATRPVPSCVLVTLGGEDAELTLTEAVAAIEGALPEASIDVVAGLFARSEPVRGARVKLHRGLPSLYDLLVSADFAVTAAGMTLYECLAAGTPAVAMPVADNQRPDFDELTSAGLIISGQPDLGAAVERLSRDAALRGRLAASGRELVDGRGAARVAEELVRAVAAAPSVGPVRGSR